jgi:nucleotide-binding universal stress UspA family protein
MRVLFCADGSEGAGRALACGVAWLKNADIQAVVLYVIPEVDERFRHYERLHEQELREIEHLFGDEGHGLEVALQARDRLKKLGLEAERKVREGDPAAEILAEIREGKYDLAILASDAEGSVENPRLGGVADEVVRSAPISVLVVRGVAHSR